MDMLDEGTSEYTAATSHRTEETCSKHIEFIRIGWFIYFAIFTEKNLSESLQLFSKVVLDPSFPEEDWEKKKKNYKI